MAPHLMRAQGAYKADKHATHTHTHTPTNTSTHPHPHAHTHTHTHTHIHTQTHTHTTHTHTHTHTAKKTTSIVVMGLMETEERKPEISRQKRRGGFSVLI